MIEASPAGVVVVGQVESIVLQCTLEGAEQADDVEYQWTREGGSLPSNTVITDGTVYTFSNK